MGYRDERAWWEVIIAVRKVAIVAIATFGTLMGRVDIQAFLALGVVFFSILVHLLGQPFNVNDTKGNLLHYLEFIALSVAWFTFWGGLMFYILPGDEYIFARICMTVLIMGTNIVFLVVACYHFTKEFIKDFKHKKERARKRSTHDTRIVPVHENGQENVHEREAKTKDDNMNGEGGKGEKGEDGSGSATTKVHPGDSVAAEMGNELLVPNVNNIKTWSRDHN